MDQKQSSCCIFLDLKEALNTKDKEYLLCKFEYFGFRGRVLTFLKYETISPTRLLEINLPVNEKRCTSRVCTRTFIVSNTNQLSPTTSEGLYHSFVDDTNILYKVSISLQWHSDTLDKVVDLMEIKKLKFKLDKSTAVCFGKTR